MKEAQTASDNPRDGTPPPHLPTICHHPESPTPSVISLGDGAENTATKEHIQGVRKLKKRVTKESIG